MFIIETNSREIARDDNMIFPKVDDVFKLLFFIFNLQYLRLKVVDRIAL